MTEVSTLRPEVTGARRVVVKVGSSSLTSAAGGIDPSRVRHLVDVLAAVRGRGAEVVLVSSGAIAAGLAPLRLARRPRGLAAQQAAASVGQGLLVHRYTEELARHGVVDPDADAETGSDAPDFGWDEDDPDAGDRK